MWPNLNERCRRQKKRLKIGELQLCLKRPTFIVATSWGMLSCPTVKRLRTGPAQIRADLRRQALEALSQIGDYALVLEHYTRAQNSARRQIAIDDLNEAAYRQLMMALSAAGQRNEALTEFAQLSQLFGQGTWC